MKEKISCSFMDDPGPCWVRILVVQECLLRVGVAAQLGFSPVGTPGTLWIPSGFVSVPELWSEGHCFHVRRSRAQGVGDCDLMFFKSKERSGADLDTRFLYCVRQPYSTIETSVTNLQSDFTSQSVSEPFNLSFKVSTEILENWFM